MRRTAIILLTLLAFAAQPLAAQEIVQETIVTETIQEFVVAEPQAAGGTRFVAAQPAQVPPGAAAYGPFRLIDESRAALVDVTESGADSAFAALLRDHPGVVTLIMADCPGTEDDRANLRLGRMIHARGIATHVPEGGFVGSGAVELFLAGTRRSADPGAQFAVHSWEDDQGHEAGDYSPDAPENQAYIEYYQAVGMTLAEARAFYAMTNSVPFAHPKWLTRADMTSWVRLDAAPGSPPPSMSDPRPATTFAVLDSPHALP